jgi:hypothetical protein
VGLLAALIALLVLGFIVRAGRGRSSGQGVQVTVEAVLRSADGHGTDVLGTIQNSNRGPVAMAVRARGYDIGDHVVVERTIGPFRDVGPGKPYPIQAYLDATPLKSVTLEPVEVQPVDASGH